MRGLKVLGTCAPHGKATSVWSCINCGPLEGLRAAFVLAPALRISAARSRAVPSKITTCDVSNQKLPKSHFELLWQSGGWHEEDQKAAMPTRPASVLRMLIYAKLSKLSCVAICMIMMKGHQKLVGGVDRNPCSHRSMLPNDPHAAGVSNIRQGEVRRGCNR